MQRRLSLGIALLGDPKIVFLDEPTTGMDPVTRRSVWDCISRAKKGRVIILTTHSMEEADILGDRVAIMSGGKLSCIGSSLHLKHKVLFSSLLFFFICFCFARGTLWTFSDFFLPFGYLVSRLLSTSTTTTKTHTTSSAAGSA